MAQVWLAARPDNIGYRRGYASGYGLPVSGWGDGTTANLSQKPETPTTAPPAVIAANGKEAAAQEPRATDQASDRATIARNNSPKPIVSKKATKSVITSVPTFVSEGTPSSSSTSADDEAIVLGEQPTSFPSPANIVPNVPETSGHNIPTSTPSAKEIPAALASLASQSIGPIEFAQNFAPTQLDVAISKPKLASRFYLDAGASYGLKGNKTGYYAGLQYSLPISKRLSIPVGLRFRRDFHQFEELAESSTPLRFLDIGNSTTATAPDTILFEFTAESLKEIVTTSFEGRIGLAYSATPRLRIGASLSVNYLQAAIARVSPQYQEAFADAQNRLLNADANISLVSDLSSTREDASFSTPIVLEAGSSSNFPTFNQWVGYAGLNATYDLTQKLSLTLSGRRLLAQPDQSKIIGLQRGQLEIGARWRLK